MTDSEYALPARRTVYQPRMGGAAIEMRSRLEAKVAAALDNHGFEWTYEPQAFATQSGQYLPDFVVSDVRIISDDDPILRTSDVIIEAVPTFGLFEARYERERAIISMITEAPLLYTGMSRPFLSGWCFTSGSKKRRMAALGIWDKTPGLFLDRLAYAWIDGYWQHAKDMATADDR